ncbi:MAG: hypothetical protein ACM34K_04060 [Bacillota bacterium]
MVKKIQIKVKKQKARIPVPQKPPKVEESKDKYNRQKTKKQTRDILLREGEKKEIHSSETVR